jgi:hypothetical protein
MLAAEALLRGLGPTQTVGGVEVLEDELLAAARIAQDLVQQLTTTIALAQLRVEEHG